MPGHSAIVNALVFYGYKTPNHPRKWWVHARLVDLLKPKIEGEHEVARNGLRLFLTPADFEHRDLFWMGTKDERDIRHLQHALAGGGVFLDIGANLGFYSLRLAQALGTACEIHAFEPHPKTNALLQRHIVANGFQANVHPHQLGVSDHAGTARMVQRGDNSGATRLEGGGNSRGSDAFDITTTTIDAFADAHDLDRLDAVKMDVEGFEAHVLRGGRQSIARWKPTMIVEFWVPGLQAAGSSCEEVASVMRELGYRFYHPTWPHAQPCHELPTGDDPVNLLCVHRDRLSSLP